MKILFAYRFVNLASVMILTIGTLVFSFSAKADVGMPKTFSMLASPMGPVVVAHISEIQLSAFSLRKGQVCADFAEFDYLAPAIHVTIGSEEYVLDKASSAGLVFNSTSCDLKMGNISGVLLKFNHAKLPIAIGLEFDFKENSVQLSSREISSGSGIMTSKY